MDKYAEIKEKFDFENDNFFYVQDFDEGLLVWQYLENEYGYDSERCRQRIFFPHQANPIISYDTEDRFICYGRDHKYPYEEYHKGRKYLSKKEVLDLIDKIDIEWIKEMGLDKE